MGRLSSHGTHRGALAGNVPPAGVPRPSALLQDPFTGHGKPAGTEAPELAAIGGGAFFFFFFFGGGAPSLFCSSSPWRDGRVHRPCVVCGAEGRGEGGGEEEALPFAC